ncbi:phage tail domain-containing protein [Streptomyces sp. Tu6071]|uniref:phage tail domain-containing protein n=1 Tax=Streptomyces sp. Tu6071 TaxID=355249 RepID=UPI001F3FCFED|nr:phage tail domain-containing protein [Streptomyces sp. Tu6071]
MPPLALFSDESPNLDGAIFRNSRTSSREIMIPVYLHGIDRQSINALKRQFFQALNPARGYCVLSFTEGSGVTRRINAYYKGGLEGSEGEESGFTFTRYGLTFTAMEPWFYADQVTSQQWTFGDSAKPFLSSTRAFLPLQVVSGVLGGDGAANVVIRNDGDIDAWPVWALTGPVKSFSLVGPDGATVEALARADGSDVVPSGRTLTIDTRPGHKTARDDLGANFWDRLSTNPVFWAVEPGETRATVNVVAGSGMASISLSFRPRFASYI